MITALTIWFIGYLTVVGLGMPDSDEGIGTWLIWFFLTVVLGVAIWPLFAGLYLQSR